MKKNFKTLEEEKISVQSCLYGITPLLLDNAMLKTTYVREKLNSWHISSI